MYSRHTKSQAEWKSKSVRKREAIEKMEEKKSTTTKKINICVKLPQLVSFSHFYFSYVSHNEFNVIYFVRKFAHRIHTRCTIMYVNIALSGQKKGEWGWERKFKGKSVKGTNKIPSKQIKTIRKWIWCCRCWKWTETVQSVTSPTLIFLHYFVRASRRFCHSFVICFAFFLIFFFLKIKKRDRKWGL